MTGWHGTRRAMTRDASTRSGRSAPASRGCSGARIAVACWGRSWRRWARTRISERQDRATFLRRRSRHRREQAEGVRGDRRDSGRGRARPYFGVAPALGRVNRARARRAAVGPGSIHTAEPFGRDRAEAWLDGTTPHLLLCRGYVRMKLARHADALADLEELVARISHQAASRRQKSSWFQEVDRDANDRAGCRLRWPCPRGSFGPVRAHAPSTVGPAMLSVASTRTGPNSSAIITAPGEKCGLAARPDYALALNWASRCGFAVGDRRKGLRLARRACDMRNRMRTGLGRPQETRVEEPCCLGDAAAERRDHRRGESGLRAALAQVGFRALPVAVGSACPNRRGG